MPRQPRYKKGDRIGGCFLVHQALMGGMGEVYLCLDERNFVPIALKTFQGSDPRLHQMFEAEVKNWIALEQHPNIVRCHFLDMFDNIPFMGLEWIASDEGKGSDLRSWLRQGPLSLDLALKFTIDIVRGLQHANEKAPGIVHRDLKPDNVLIDQSRRAKITDFGLALAVQQSDLDTGLAEDGSAMMGQSMRVSNIVGTPAYMPPEQWRGETNLDFRADVYAVGCILYELLTGKWLYTAHTIGELRAKHLEAPIPPINGDQPPGVKTILDSCLAKHREDRFERLELLFEELKQLFETYTGERLPKIVAAAYTAVDYFNRAVTFYNLGEYERAITNFDQAIALDSSLVRAYDHRGTIYMALGRHEQAIADYNQALTLNPGFAPAYHNRGNIYAALGQVARAIADYDQAIALDPGITQVYYNRGSSYAALDQHIQAIADYDQAIVRDPNIAQAYYNRGNSYAALGRLTQAIADFDRAIAVKPGFAPAYHNRGTMYAALGQLSQALADYSQAVTIDPGFAQAYSNRGTTYAQLGQFERAIDDFKQSIALNPNNDEAYLQMAVILAMLGRLEEAIQWGEKAVEHGAEQAVEFLNQVRQDLGRTPVKPNNPQVAFEAFIRAASPDAIRQAVQQYPLLGQMVPSIEQIIKEQVPPDIKSELEQKLNWLRQIVEED